MPGLRLNRLPERDPESVTVANDELTHTVERIVEPFHDLNAVLKAAVQVIDVAGQYVKVDLAAMLSARLPPASNMTSLLPKIIFAQLISPSSSFCRINANPIEMYHATVVRTSGT
jgi:hypothetical protein